MKLFKLTIFFFIIFFSVCCKRQTKSYNNLKNSRNTNKVEIEKLLNYYRNERNAEKRRMTEYLLDYLPEHFNLTYYIEVAGAGRINLNYSIHPDSVDVIRSVKGNRLIVDTTNVLTSINASHLIRHIERSYELRKQYSWVKNLSLDDFLKYVLPMRINNEPLYDYQAFYQNRYISYIGDVVAVQNVNPSVILENYLTPFFERQSKYDRYIDFTSKLDFNRMKDGLITSPDLEDVMVLQVHALRSFGIPCTYEYAPVIDNLDRGEMVVACYDGTNRTFKNEIYSNIYKYRVPKFYRNNFDCRSSMNPFTKILKMGIKVADIPLSLNIPNLIDITSERTVAHDILIRLDSMISKKEKILYLAAGIGDAKRIVSWSTVDTSSRFLKFPQMGVQIEYQLARYKNGKISLIGDAFILKEDGKIDLINK